MSTRMKNYLVIDAFLQGYKKEHPKKGLIIHTDQGSQYTNSNFQATLKKYGAVSSVSRKGNPYDNALMESFYKTIKRELYYNTKRMHSFLDYLSPIEFEKAYS
ncbi:hypothetical protein BK702_09895 [Bacillus thuringiensis serovar cameroun]|nr:hypothetical protein BK702_09895 [Bacillus thuringiensis serovar cameroun]